MSKFAWVTLTTNDTYSLGALVLAHSLKRAGTAHQLAVLVTPTVSEAMRDRLKDVYNVVQEVNVLDSQDAANLALLARPELGVTFTKLHCWRLVQFEKCVFLDADTLVLKNCDELFEREELSAAPDVSWPDCFNSGVFVFKPSVETFTKITEYAVQHGSFDGGDQGLLNQFFGDWATADIKKHLPFVYNVTAYASYCYLPAFKQFRDKIKILHFAGKLKPWLIQFNSETKTVATPSEYAHAQDLIQHWWTIFCDNVHQSLSDQMYLCLNITHSTSYADYAYETDSYYHHHHHQQQQEQEYPVQPYVPQIREYRDPWADYYEQVERQQNEPQPESWHNEHDSHEQGERRGSWSQSQNQSQSHSESHSQSQNDAFRPTSPSPQAPPPPPPPPPQQPPTANEDSTSTDVNSYEQAQPIHEPHTHHPTIQTNSNANSNQNLQNTQNEVEDEQVPIEAEAGLAGALAQLCIGVQRTPEQEQYENLMRRQCWEAGQIDYAGADAFDNIWKKITQTLEGKTDKDADTDNDNDSDPDNDNDNPLSSNHLLTETANKLLQQAQPQPRPASKASPNSDPSPSSTNNPGAGVTEIKASPAAPPPAVVAATTNKLPTNAQKTERVVEQQPGRTTAAAAVAATSKANPVATPLAKPGATPTTSPLATAPKAPQRTHPAAQAVQSQPQPQPQLQPPPQPQHILPQNVAPVKPNRQKASQQLTSADIEDGKIEYDRATGASTQYKLIEGGYEMITTTPQPNGTVKTQVRTFWDPKPVSEADLAKEQANKKLVKQRLGKEIRIDEKTTMLTRAIEGGYEEVYTTINEDGTRSMRTKTFYDSVPTEVNENTTTKVNKTKKNVTRKSSVDSTDSTESSTRRVVQKVQKNVVQNTSDQQSNYREDTTYEETRRVSQNIEITENNRTVRKNSLQEQSIKAISQSTNDATQKKKKKPKSSAPPPPADFVQNDTTTVASKRVPGGVEYTYSTELESGKTITTSKTVYEEEEVELTEEEIKQYKKTLKDAEKHKNVTTTKKLKSESGTKKIVPSENPGDVTTVETIKIQGGTEYHYTTVTSEGIVKKAVKTVYDPVPSSNPDDTDEEEIIEEYEEEIIEPGEKTVKTIETVKQLPRKFEEEVTITHEKKEKKVKKSMIISQ